MQDTMAVKVVGVDLGTVEFTQDEVLTASRVAADDYEVQEILRGDTAIVRMSDAGGKSLISIIFRVGRTTTLGKLESIAGATEALEVYPHLLRAAGDSWTCVLLNPQAVIDADAWGLDVAGEPVALDFLEQL